MDASASIKAARQWLCQCGAPVSLGFYVALHIVRPVKRGIAKRSNQDSAGKEAEAAGIDMSLLEANLRKTPSERIRAHDRALATALALREAVQRATKKSHAGS